jgi:hypothetical protein
LKKTFVKQKNKNQEKKLEIEYLKYKYDIAIQNFYLEEPIEILSFEEFKKVKYCKLL